MEGTSNVKALEKALSLLDAVREANRPLGVNELAKLCSLSPATAFRMLKTLLSHGWVYQDENEKYILGHKISFVTEKTSFWLAMKEVAYFVMARLSVSEQQAMNLVVRDGAKCYILGQSRTEKIVDYVPPVGTVLPVYASACGKILLSELPDKILGGILDLTEMKRMTPYTITDRNKFSEELCRVRERGYALDAHESQEEGFCIAVPVRAKTGEIISALSFSGFIGQKTVDEIDYYVNLLKKASAEITVQLFQLKPRMD
jgi:DNA-binding IclR family transcriptional regulator